MVIKWNEELKNAMIDAGLYGCYIRTSYDPLNIWRKDTQTFELVKGNGFTEGYIYGKAEVDMIDGLAVTMEIKDPKYKDVFRTIISMIIQSQFPDDPEMMCSNVNCTYMKPHRHGFACTKDCRCNRHGRVD